MADYVTRWVAGCVADYVADWLDVNGCLADYVTGCVATSVALWLPIWLLGIKTDWVAVYMHASYGCVALLMVVWMRNCVAQWLDCVIDGWNIEGFMYAFI